MKIGIIIPQSKFFGGGPRIALELAQSLRRMGHHIVLYTFRHVEDEGANFDDLVQGFPIVTLPSNIDFKRRPFLGLFYIPGTSSLLKYRHELKLAKMLARRIDQDIEALIPQTTRSSIITAYYFKRLYKKNIPVIWQMNDMVTFTFKACYGESWANNSCSFFQKICYGVMDLLDRHFIAAANEISVLANVIENQVQHGLHRKAVVVRVGVNTDQFKYSKREVPAGKILLLGHAQFFPHRRFEDAVEALAILTKKGYDATLTLSGDSDTYHSYREYRDKIKHHAQNHGVLSRVLFPGKISEDDFLKELQKAHFFLFPHIRQSWGLVPFEAMATGLPVIASDQAGATEVMTHRKNAFVVPAESPKSIADAIEELIQNPHLYQNISENGSQFVRNELTWDAYARNMYKLIEKHLTHRAL